jgi:hypothetical protein
MNRAARKATKTAVARQSAAMKPVLNVTLTRVTPTLYTLVAEGLPDVSWAGKRLKRHYALARVEALRRSYTVKLEERDERKGVGLATAHAHSTGPS